MKFVALLLLVTDLLLMCHALDDDEDEDRKYSVTFFQFNPKDLSILGGHRKDKRHIRRSDVETLPKSTNNTIGKINSASAKSSNESNVPTNSTSSLAKQTGNTTIGVNETNLIHNMSEYHTKDNSSIHSDATTATDINIMNTLIDLAVKKKNQSAISNDVPSANKTDTRSINTTSDATAQKPSPLSNTTSAANKTAAPATNITKKSYVTSKRNEVLNPNPKPSEREAMLNVKVPKQLEHKEHDPSIHSENTSKTVATEDKHETTTNAVEMVKNKNKETDKGSEQNVTEPVSDAEKDKAEEEKKKLLKDKETNKEIKEGAKDIQPVTNTVGNVNDIMKESGDQKNAHARTSVNEVDDKVIKHRTSVAEFVPLYHSTTVKDHKLSFQVGSMKHPKHNIHPSCHACPLNSTYKDCVKKSTLRQCNEGLNNICFTKSTKKKGVITYEMGCSDHNNCVHAKAFPCKDDKEHCFTCCQFDRCNSSPHHGDYELDELNLDELADPVTSATFKDSTILDSKSDSYAISGTWITYVSTIFVVLILRF